MKLAHSRDLFRTFICDNKSLVSACEQSPDLFTHGDKLLTNSTLFHVLLLADIDNLQHVPRVFKLWTNCLGNMFSTRIILPVVKIYF